MYIDIGYGTNIENKECNCLGGVGVVVVVVVVLAVVVGGSGVIRLQYAPAASLLSQS